MFGIAVDDSHNYHEVEYYQAKAKADAAKAAAAKKEPAKPLDPATSLDAIQTAANVADASKPAAPAKQSRNGRGWIMVRAAKLEANDLIAAMEAGDFYASSGVTLKDVRREPNRLSLEIEAQPGVIYTTEFFGTRKGYDQASAPVLDAKGAQLRTTRRYSKDVGAVLATVTGPKATYELKGDEIYVRARVTSSKPKADAAYPGEVEQAWTQPLVPAGK
jgi:hypothetical protein